ncbi:hypothetical protein UNDYM_0382 [Undibacterium sp. YM2]|nr:hypothetical protein UNDYM_0382 [Undibacterium sp. YM2]
MRASSGDTWAQAGIITDKVNNAKNKRQTERMLKAIIASGDMKWERLCQVWQAPYKYSISLFVLKMTNTCEIDLHQWQSKSGLEDNLSLKWR